MSSHTGPLYISESCPSYVRGRFITNYQLAITIGIMIAYAVGGTFSYIDPVYVGWRYGKCLSLFLTVKSK